MDIYKDEDSKIIYEYLKEYDAETEKRKQFSSALKRKLLEIHYLKEELKNVRFNNKMILEEKLDAVDVLYDTFKFLDRYEENIVILNQARLDEREK